MQIPNEFDRHEGHFLLENNQITSGDTAHEVMREANALFPVSYPAACWQSPNGLAGYSNYGGEYVAAVVPRVTSGAYKGKPMHKYVLRTDTNQELGLHSCKYPETDGYNPIADMAEELFPNSATTCTVFGAGERVALTQKLTEPVDLGGGDVIQPQICWISSLNGTWRTAVYDLTERLFCQNQLVGQRPLISVKHTKNHDDLLSMRVTILQGARDRTETLANMAKVMVSQEFTDIQFMALVNELAPWKEEMSQRAKNINETNRYAFRQRWVGEKEEWGAGNMWLAFNAIQGAEQHLINGASRGRYSKDKAYEKALDGKTPLATEAMRLLMQVPLQHG